MSCINIWLDKDLPLRGHDDDSDSNFIQLLKHCGEDDREIHQWQRKNPTSTHHMKSRILWLKLWLIRKVSENLHKSPFLTVMIDETTDVTNQEQVKDTLTRLNLAFHKLGG